MSISLEDLDKLKVRVGRALAAWEMPWQEVERLQALYDELIYAVATKFEGETRHETALRYIREREEAADHNHGEGAQ